MRVALISDLHGNLVALRAVLEELRSAKVDRIVCLGDVATLGPAPHEVIETLAALGCQCLRGNHDDFLLDAETIEKYTDAPVIVQAVRECRAAMNQAELDFVRRFEETLELDLDGALLGLFHGSPRSNTEDLLATTTPQELDEALGARRTTVMAGGHTHIQMLRQHHGTLLVNPGSVGLAFEAFVNHAPPRILPHAEYALVESVRGAVSVTLRRLPLDVQALARAVERWDSPLRDYLRKQYGAS